MRAILCPVSYLAFAASTFASLKPPSGLPEHAKPTARIAGISAPEIIFFNGIIYTGVGFAEDKPEIVQAMAIGGGKVLAVGTTRRDHPSGRT